MAMGSRTLLSISRSYLTLRHEENTQEEFCLLSRKESQYSWLKMSPQLVFAPLQTRGSTESLSLRRLRNT